MASVNEKKRRAPFSTGAVLIIGHWGVGSWGVGSCVLFHVAFYNCKQRQRRRRRWRRHLHAPPRARVAPMNCCRHHRCRRCAFSMINRRLFFSAHCSNRTRALFHNHRCSMTTITMTAAASAAAAATVAAAAATATTAVERLHL